MKKSLSGRLELPTLRLTAVRANRLRHESREKFLEFIILNNKIVIWPILSTFFHK